MHACPSMGENDQQQQQQLENNNIDQSGVEGRNYVLNIKSKRQTATTAISNTTSSRLQKRSTSKSSGKGKEKLKHRHSQDYYGAIATTDIQFLGPKIVKEINDFQKKISSSKFQRMIVQLIGDLMKVRSFQRSVKEFLKTIGTTVRTNESENAAKTQKKKIEISDDSMDYDY